MHMHDERIQFNKHLIISQGNYSNAQALFLSMHLCKMHRFMQFRKYCTSPLDITRYCIEDLGKNLFNGIISKAKVVKVDSENFVVDLKVEEEYLNNNGDLHGGFITTLVDCLCSYYLMTHKLHTGVPCLTTNIHLMFIKPAKIDDEIFLDIRFTDVGQKVTFTNCEIRNKATNELLVKGGHTQIAPGTVFF